MGINLTGPGASLSSATLIADSVKTVSGSTDGTASLTEVGGIPVSACLELQSTQGAFLLPRMTAAQMNALVTVVNGMQVFNTDAGGVYTRQNGGWFQSPSTNIQIEITAAQFLALAGNGGSLLVIPAPVAGSLILVENARLELIFNTTQYQAGGPIKLQYGNGDASSGTAASSIIAAASVNGTTVTTIFGFNGQLSTGSIAVAGAINQGIYLSVATQNFTTGNSRFILTASYKVITP